MVLEVGEGVDSNAGIVENVKEEAQDAIEKEQSEQERAFRK